MWNVRLPFYKYQSFILRRGSALDSRCGRCGLEADVDTLALGATEGDSESSEPAAATSSCCQPAIFPLRALTVSSTSTAPCYTWPVWWKLLVPASVLQLGICLQLLTCTPTCVCGWLAVLVCLTLWRLVWRTSITVCGLDWPGGIAAYLSCYLGHRVADWHTHTHHVQAHKVIYKHTH